MPFRDSRSSTTVLPPSSFSAAARADSIKPARLQPLCPVRMAAADAAEREVAELCEEISRVVRKPPAKKPEAAARGNSQRPSVPRRKVRKAVPQ